MRRPASEEAAPHRPLGGLRADEYPRRSSPGLLGVPPLCRHPKGAPQGGGALFPPALASAPAPSPASAFAPAGGGDCRPSATC